MKGGLADIEEGFHDLQDAFPNFWVDYYPFAVGEPPHRLPEAFPEGARDLLVGWAVGNPFSEPLKLTAVEDSVAEGFGTTPPRSARTPWAAGSG